MNLSTRLPVKDHELTKLKNPLSMAMEPAILYSFNGKSSMQKNYTSRNQHSTMNVFLEIELEQEVSLPLNCPTQEIGIAPLSAHAE